MKVVIANHEFPMLCDHVYSFALSRYPCVSEWELKKLILFREYEKSHGRATEITCEDSKISETVNHALAHPHLFLSAQKPDLITECTACRQKGCLTEFVCHTASIENAKSIIQCGKILSAVKARKQSGAELAKEPRNAAKDPPDFFDYIMFAWGNCQAGDRLVMERMLKRFPDEEDLSAGFRPGVRFYFRYDDLIKHPSHLFDGYHPLKIKDELELADWLFACVIPADRRPEFETIIPEGIAVRTFYIENDCKDIWDWSDKVYHFIADLL